MIIRYYNITWWFQQSNEYIPIVFSRVFSMQKFILDPSSFLASTKSNALYLWEICGQCVSQVRFAIIRTISGYMIGLRHSTAKIMPIASINTWYWILESSLIWFATFPYKFEVIANDIITSCYYLLFSFANQNTSSRRSRDLPIVQHYWFLTVAATSNARESWNIERETENYADFGQTNVIAILIYNHI